MTNQYQYESIYAFKWHHKCDGSLYTGWIRKEESFRRDAILRPSLTQNIRNVSHHIKQNLIILFIPWHCVDPCGSEVT